MPPETSLRGDQATLIEMRAKLADLDRRMAAHEERVRKQLEAMGLLSDLCADQLAGYEGTDD